MVTANTHNLTTVIDGDGVAPIIARKRPELDDVAATPKDCLWKVGEGKETSPHDLTAIADVIGNACCVTQKCAEIGDGSALPANGMNRAGYVCNSDELSPVVHSGG